MKRVLILFVFLSGCASAPAQQSTTPAQPSPPNSLKQVTHEDLQAAAAYADAHGFPARADMWRAIDMQLAAMENQLAACKAAIEAAKPAPSISGVVGLATLTEVGAEAVAQGIPASVKANCEPIVIPSFLIPFPKP